MNIINLIAFTTVFSNAYELSNHHREVDQLAEVSSKFIRGCSPMRGCQGGGFGGN